MATYGKSTIVYLFSVDPRRLRSAGQRGMPWRIPTTFDNIHIIASWLNTTLLWTTSPTKPEATFTTKTFWTYPSSFASAGKVT
eukprot:11362629-Karenia_brevis.AAC.1